MSQSHLIVHFDTIYNVPLEEPRNHGPTLLNRQIPKGIFSLNAWVSNRPDYIIKTNRKTTETGRYNLNLYRDFHHAPEDATLIVEIYRSIQRKLVLWGRVDIPIKSLGDDDDLQTFHFSSSSSSSSPSVASRDTHTDIPPQLTSTTIALCRRFSRPEDAPPKRMTLFIVRHGESKWNEAQKDWNISGLLGERDHPLTGEGIQQAVELNAFWKKVQEDATLNPTTLIEKNFGGNFDSLEYSPELLELITESDDRDASDKDKDKDPSLKLNDLMKQSLLMDSEQEKKRNEEYSSIFSRVNHVYCSPLTRAIETALVAMEGHPAMAYSGLTLCSKIREVKNMGGLDTVGIAYGHSEIIRRVRQELSEELGPDRAFELLSTRPDLGALIGDADMERPGSLTAVFDDGVVNESFGIQENVPLSGPSLDGFSNRRASTGASSRASVAVPMHREAITEDELRFDVEDADQPWWNSISSYESVLDQQERIRDFLSYIRYSKYCSEYEDPEHPACVLVGHSLLFKALVSMRISKFLLSRRPSLCSDLRRYRLANASLLAITIQFTDPQLPDTIGSLGPPNSNSNLSPTSDFSPSPSPSPSPSGSTSTSTNTKKGLFSSFPRQGSWPSFERANEEASKTGLSPSASPSPGTGDEYDDECEEECEDSDTRGSGNSNSNSRTNSTSNNNNNNNNNIGNENSGSNNNNSNNNHNNNNSNNNNNTTSSNNNRGNSNGCCEAVILDAHLLYGGFAYEHDGGPKSNRSGGTNSVRSASPMPSPMPRMVQQLHSTITSNKRMQQGREELTKLTQSFSVWGKQMGGKVANKLDDIFSDG